MGSLDVQGLMHEYEAEQKTWDYGVVMHNRRPEAGGAHENYGEDCVVSKHLRKQWRVAEGLRNVPLFIRQILVLVSYHCIDAVGLRVAVLTEESFQEFRQLQ